MAGQVMAKLSREAREILRYAYRGGDRYGYTAKEWAETTGAIGADGKWCGDSCGCSDDRCIGYHHDETDACQCLPSLIDWHAEHGSA
jgi:hypothetical protein